MLGKNIFDLFFITSKGLSIPVVVEQDIDTICMMIDELTIDEQVKAVYPQFQDQVNVCYSCFWNALLVQLQDFIRKHSIFNSNSNRVITYEFENIQFFERYIEIYGIAKFHLKIYLSMDNDNLPVSILITKGEVEYTDKNPTLETVQRVMVQFWQSACDVFEDMCGGNIGKI